jgi:hypothetical protein
MNTSMSGINFLQKSNILTEHTHSYCYIHFIKQNYEQVGRKRRKNIDLNTTNLLLLLFIIANITIKHNFVKIKINKRHILLFHFYVDFYFKNTIIRVI